MALSELQHLTTTAVAKYGVLRLLITAGREKGTDWTFRCCTQLCGLGRPVWILVRSFGARRLGIYIENIDVGCLHVYAAPTAIVFCLAQLP